jgi:uncharacterized protein (TIGR03437 family)
VKSFGVAVVLLSLSCAAQAASFSVLSGASYQQVIAPNSWAVAFGSGLAQSTATATLGKDGQWPTTLAGTTVQVNGQAAEIYYISATQVNFLVPNITQFGTVTVSIIAASGATQTATVTLQNSAVGVFTTDSTGSGPGAILNGVTGAPAPFLVVTPENGGTDLRTRLAVYCTGLRYAGNPTQDPSITNIAANVTAQGMDAAGNPYTFTVEYAGGSDPAFPGLDQVNIILPAQLDGGGKVTLTLFAENVTSNPVTFQVNSLASGSLALTALTLSVPEILGGSDVTGTVQLNGRAGTSGFPVSIKSNDPNLILPPVVNVPSGQSSATFTITTPTTGASKTDTITAQAAGVTLNTSLQIDPSNAPKLSSFTVTAATVQGGTNFTGSVGLTASAPLGGVNVQLASSDTAAQPPASVSVPTNSTTANVTIPTTAVTSPHSVTLTATLGSTSLTQSVTVAPPIQLTLDNASVTGGTNVTATVSLGNAAPAGGANILLSSNASAVASTPLNVSIPSGENTATFTITTFGVTAAHTVTITATYPNVGSATASLTVNPVTAGQLVSVAVSPGSVSGGGPATGTVTLSGPAPANGLVVALKSSNVLVASVPITVNVVQGSSTATFTVSTNKVATSQTVTITATAGATSKTTTLTVQP